MRVVVISLFPDMFDAIFDYGVLGRAIKNNLLSVSIINPRDYAEDKHRTVDDRPYGGGPGMVMTAPVLKSAIQVAKQRLADEVEGNDEPQVIYLSPQGTCLSQEIVREYAEQSINEGKGRDLILLCGRYEGIDERLIEAYIDREISIGDYVLSGGEFAAMVMIDAVSRCIDGVLGDEQSAEQDSFGEEGLLDCPHYTRPEEFEGQLVPTVLLSGDHKKIDQWRCDQAIERTKIRRPDLYQQYLKRQQKLS